MKKVPGKDGKPQDLAAFQGWLAKNLLEQKLPIHLRPTLAAAHLDADNMKSYVDNADQLWGSDVAAQRRVTVSAVEGKVAAVKDTNSNTAKAVNKGGGKSGGGSRANGRLVDRKCRVHNKYGADAFSCANPAECSMKGKIKKKTKVAEITAAEDD